MIKDIPTRKVEDLAIAIVPPENPAADSLWDVYILNLYQYPLLSVMVTSRGYGEIEGEKRQTSTLRYFFDDIAPMDAQKIEPIQPAVFELANEFWVSFSLGDYLFDKKYVFVKGSIQPDHFTTIPLLNRKGVMIR